MNIYLASKRSTEANISKKNCFHNERRFWPIFPCIVECVKPQGTLYKCVQAIATITLEIFRAFFKDLRGCWKHKFLRNRGNMSIDEKVLAHFFSWYRTWKPSGNSLQGLTRSFDIFRANDMNIYLAPKRSFETNIWKDSWFHDETSFWPIFPCNIELDKPQGTIYNGPQAILANTLEVGRVDGAFS